MKFFDATMQNGPLWGTGSGAQQPSAAVSRRFGWPLSLVNARSPQSGASSHETVDIGDDRISIQFSRQYANAPSTIKDVSVLVRLRTGAPLVAYHLTGEIPTERIQNFRDTLSFGEQKTFTPMETLQSLLALTRACGTLAWIPERLDAVVKNERLVEPMRRVVPTIEDFAADPEGSCSRFFCSKPIDGSVWRMEAEIKAGQRAAKIELLQIDGLHRITHKTLFPEIQTSLGADADLTEVSKDLVLRCYLAMEVFWNGGPTAASEHLLGASTVPAGNPTSASDDSASTEVTFRDETSDVDHALGEGILHPSQCEYTHEFPSGAELLLAAGNTTATLLLRSHADEDASFYAWRFQSASADLSDSNNPIRREIMEAIKMLKLDSDGLRLQAIHKLLDLQNGYYSHAPTLESLLGFQAASELDDLPGVDVRPAEPLSRLDILGLCNGKQLVTISLSDRSLQKSSPHICHSAQIGLLPDDSITVEAVNMLKGRCSAIISAKGLENYGGRGALLRDLATALTQQQASSTAVVQDLLRHTCALDEDASLFSIDGDPEFSELPPSEDAQGHRMYRVAANLIRAYADISKSNPGDYKASWKAPGTIEATLGMGEHEPFLMKLTVADSTVIAVDLIPQMPRGDGSFEPDLTKVVSYQLRLPILSLEPTEARRSRDAVFQMMRLFNALLNETDLANGAASLTPLTSTPLCAFLKSKSSGTTPQEEA